MRLITVTQSVCAECGQPAPAKVVEDGGNVHMLKFCPEHGESRAFIRSDADDYMRTLRYVKPASVPMAAHGDASAPCPDGCGYCSRHEQHLCMPIIEITSRCDLACPICINESGGPAGSAWDMTPDEFGGILDRLVAAEGKIDLLNISGGEPLLHQDILRIVDMALAREAIVRVSISTNGLRLLRNPALVSELKARNVVVSLQLDGFSDEVCVKLRGRPLAYEKREILDTLKDADVTTSLVMTAATGINDDRFPEILGCLFGYDNIVSLMVQPLAYTGRAKDMPGKERRLTIPDITRLIGEAGVPFVSREDFIPLPCSHPLCFSLAFYLMTVGGQAVAFARLADMDGMLDSLANRVVYGLDPDEHARLRQMVYDLWSGPVAAAPESLAVLSTLRGILREMSEAPACCFDPRAAFTMMERKVKSIFIHAFQDRDTFDIARVRRCCQGYPQPDGRVLPACVRNNTPRFMG
ncbi:MAG: radical SAM protein [Nitrospirae bacterium]|nr:radical SAM protein [Nitrospirota bacterium]